MLTLTVVAPGGAAVPKGARLYKLTPDQIRRRQNMLEPVTEGEADKKKALPLATVALAGAGVMFKKGETITVDEELIKALAKDGWADAEGRTLAERHFLERDAKRKKGVAEVEAKEKANPAAVAAAKARPVVTERAVR